MRVKRGYVLRRKHNRVLKLAKGFRGSRHRLFKTANEAVLHSLHYAYVGRRDRKNDSVSFGSAVFLLLQRQMESAILN